MDMESGFLADHEFMAPASHFHGVTASNSSTCT